MKIGDLLKNNGNNLLQFISDQVGGPELPALQLTDPNQNNNNYVTSREAPAAYQAEANAAPSRNWIMYGAIGLGVVVAIGLLMRK